MSQDTGKFRTNTKDKYYTRKDIAEKCVKGVVEILPWAKEPTTLWIEPAAGNGSFLDAARRLGISQRLGIELEPPLVAGRGSCSGVAEESTEILKGNFLKWTPPSRNETRKKLLVFGNPPFGRQASTAKNFLKHAASFADSIAFILPRSFSKPSMTSTIPLIFHCVYDTDIETNAFLVNDTPYNVPCIFQIWSRNEAGILRTPVKKISPIGFEFVKKGEEWNAAIRRVGGKAGTFFLRAEGLDLSAQSHNFLTIPEISLEGLQTLQKKVNSHTFPTNTTGPRSISGSEIAEVLNPLIHGLLQRQRQSSLEHAAPAGQNQDAVE